jgi:hypothetical protein
MTYTAQHTDITSCIHPTIITRSSSELVVISSHIQIKSIWQERINTRCAVLLVRLIKKRKELSQNAVLSQVQRK